MRAAIDTLMSIKAKRHIAILSDMLEMGEYAMKYHMEIGKYAAQSGMDMIISVGDNAKFISEGAYSEDKNNLNLFHFENNEKLIYALDQLLQPEDIVLVKGSRGMKMEQIVDYILGRG